MVHLLLILVPFQLICCELLGASFTEAKHLKLTNFVLHQHLVFYCLDYLVDGKRGTLQMRLKCEHLHRLHFVSEVYPSHLLALQSTQFGQEFNHYLLM